LGTALIGVLILIEIFNGLLVSVEASNISGNMTQEQIQSSLLGYVEKVQTVALQDIPPSLMPEVNQIIDSTISSAMKQTFNALTLILILGFIKSIFLPKKKK
jgi:hypothetical protein